jgi:hypothetical protein
MKDPCKLFAALFIALIVGSTMAFDLVSPAEVADNVTLIHKTDPHWPAKGAISVDPCFHRGCLAV